MFLDKIKKFYKSIDACFEKQAEIQKAIKDFECLKYQANQDLSNTIDNGFDSKQLVQVNKSYVIDKFNSSDVQDFLQRVNDMFFKDLESTFKESLEVVSLNILGYSGFSDNFYNDCLNNCYVYSPIKINFWHSKTNKFFTLCIPIKDSICFDVNSWNETNTGMYTVTVYSTTLHCNRKICCVFDSNKICEAVQKYLNGDFDDEINTEMYEIVSKSNYQSYFLSKSYLEYNDIIYEDLNNFQRQFNIKKYEDCIPSCIDDRDLYKT